MADGVWNRQGMPMYPSSSSAGLLKRPRTEYEPLSSGMASGQEFRNYAMQDDDRGAGAQRVVRDTDAIGSAYDRYLQSTQVSSFGSGDLSNLAVAGGGRGTVGGVSGMVRTESLMRGHPQAMGSDPYQNGQGRGVVGQAPIDPMSRRGHEPMPLPLDASKTLYVEGLPSDASRREVAHIFRPFVGYKEVRLVFKESKHRGEPMTLCFVDFADPACAATAMNALQGYEMDEHRPDSSVLRIQFSRYGPRSAAAGSRGRR